MHMHAHADSIACAGLTSFENDEGNLNRVHFVWGQSKAVLAIKINCLSSEFAAKKHGIVFIGRMSGWLTCTY